ncbi:hypothetical protein ACJW31_09G101500 [Castanea mollissima]
MHASESLSLSCLKITGDASITSPPKNECAPTVFHLPPNVIRSGVVLEQWQRIFPKHSLMCSASCLTSRILILLLACPRILFIGSHSILWRAVVNANPDMISKQERPLV